MFSVVLLLPLLQAIELPLAPFNVKVFCRQGRSYSHEVQTATQCPSPTTACGFFEFKSPDLERGVDNIGVYECVDNGILQSNANDVDEDNLKLFTQLCGATPQCSHLNLNKLNTLFAKYLFVHHHIQLELLTSHTIRFCCSLFHHTLQKLVTSGKDRLPAIPAPPIHCESEMCEKDAVGCLLHSHAANEESDEYYDDDDDDHGNDHDNNYETRESVRQKRQHQEHRVEEDERIDAVQLFFDFEEEEHDPSLQIVTRFPSHSPPSATALRQVGVSRPTASPLRKPSPADRSQNAPVASSDTPGEHTDDYEKLDDTDDVHCVYRHLNDELYRYCLLVHQGKDGDRCYQHEGHTICCCFVPPDKETCDPTEIDLVRSPVKTRFSSIRVTPWPDVMKVSSTAMRSSNTNTANTTTATATTTTTAATTTTAITTTTTATTFGSITTNAHDFTSASHTVRTTYTRNTSLSRTRFIASKSTGKSRCRVTYPRKKTSTSKRRPVLVCDSAHFIINSLLLFMLLLRFL